MACLDEGHLIVAYWTIDGLVLRSFDLLFLRNQNVMASEYVAKYFGAFTIFLFVFAISSVLPP